MLEAYEYHESVEELEKALKWLYADIKAKLSAADTETAIKQVKNIVNNKIQETK